MSVLKKINCKLYKIQSTIVIILFALMVILISVNVVCRYVFHNSFFGITEVSCYLLVYIILIGTSMALYDGKHVVVKNEKRKLSKKMMYYVSILSYAVVYVFILSLIVVGGYLSFINMSSYTGTIHIPMGLVYLAAPVSGVFMAFEHTELFMRFLSGGLD